jgi:hypothetical protein
MNVLVHHAFRSFGVTVSFLQFNTTGVPVRGLGEQVTSFLTTIFAYGEAAI